jgi:hypothetical protein
MDSNYSTAVVSKANLYAREKKAGRITQPWIILEGSSVDFMLVHEPF